MADRDPPPPAAAQEDRQESVPGPTVVGIGASAGGLAALQTFFSHIPERSGLAFVVVVHLNPEQESHLADLLQPHVPFAVQQVTETMPLEADRVYVIPPGANLESIDTHLRLSRLEAHRRDRAPIDHFFRTLAATHDGHSVGVILTGTGSDGSLGVKAIKEKGGFTLAQDPGEAEYDGMPRNAISTGLVDRVLPLAEIPDAVLRYARTEPKVAIPADDEKVESEQNLLLQKIFVQVRARTGRDFSRYKRSTLLRRIQRRMQLRQVEELGEYLERLREETDEVVALADDILITVTNFFRDPEIWDTLAAEVIPSLFEARKPEDSVRVWSVGCATGEEAYSLAMLLIEQASLSEKSPRIQVFASDLHERSLERAREGFYPGDIEADVSPERLRRFFDVEDGGYRVRKEVREQLVFAAHNLLGDPPFSGLDLVMCRNVLIYLQRDVQQEVIDLFHYALRPEGRLVLGSSETVESSELFRLEDKRHCLYRKRNVRARKPRLPVFPQTRPRAAADAGRREHAAEPVAFGILHHRMIERYGPPSMLVSPDHRVVHLSEHAGRYLVHPGGELATNAFKLVRKELRIELRAALLAAREQARPTRSCPIPVRFEGGRGLVTLDVRPALDGEQEGFTLVLFDERPPAGTGPEGAEEGPATPPGKREREAELELSEKRLQAIVEEYETSQEEMRASHEELQSANEELRSTLEELETSKEELQSMNEELQTVNQENRHKVEELAQLSGDLQNLLAATDIATLFLDRELRILRFTPQVGELFNVRPVDRGRPLSDLTHRLGYDELRSDAEAVLRRLVPVEREVQDEHGRWYLTRVLPYRSATDRIEGVVITFIEITGRKEAEEGLRESDAQHSFLLALTDRLRPLSDAQEIMGAATEALGRQLGLAAVGYLEADDEGETPPVRSRYSDGRIEDPGAPFRSSEGGCGAALRAGEEIWKEDAGAGEGEAPDGIPRAVAAVPLVKAGRRVACLYAAHPEPRPWPETERRLFRDVAERTWAEVDRARAEAALRESEMRLRLIVESARDYAILTTDPEGRIDGWSPGAEAAFRWSAAEALGRDLAMTFTPEDRSAGVPGEELAAARRDGSTPDVRWHLRRDGSRVFIEGTTRALRDGDGVMRGFLKIGQDVTERRRTEAELRALNESLERRVDERTAELAAQIQERARAEEARREVLRQLVSAEEVERRRISRELHDQTGQQATGLMLGLRALQQVVHSPELAERIRDLERMTAEMSRDMQHLALELRPPALDNLGLISTLRSHLEEWGERHGIECDFHAVGMDGGRLPPELETTLYRVVQEGLTNALKHAGASHVSLILERRAGTVSAILEDDGAGFEVEAALASLEKTKRLGLRGMRERVALLGGELEIESSPGGGTTIFVRVPAPAGSEQAQTADAAG